PGPLACWACAGNAEESLLISNLPASSASATGCRSFAVCAARAFAGIALLKTAVGNLLLRSEDCFLKFDGDVFAQIGAALGTCTAASATASAKDVAEPEELAEDVVEVLENAGIKAATSSRAPYARMPEPVIHASFFGVGQDGVSLATFLELFFRIRIIRIAVGMELQRQLAVRALDFLLARAPLDAEHLVIISFYVARQSLTLAKISVCRYAPRAPWPDVAADPSICNHAVVHQ